MGDKTAISWADHTWNPWQGCRRLSAGCKNCYMFREKLFYGQDPTKVVRSKTTFRDPVKKHGRKKHPSPDDPPVGSWKWPDGDRVFVCSWSDFFIEEADAWRDEAWAIIRQRPDVAFLILTKRAHRIHNHLPDDWGPNGYHNVWLGVSIEDQRSAEDRIPWLLRVPAALRFLSCEPLLGPLNLVEMPSFLRTEDNPDGARRPLLRHNALRGGHWCGNGVWIDDDDPQDDDGMPAHRIHWVITGGESGDPHEPVRPMHPQWVRDIRDQCATAGTLFHHKQNGEWMLRSTKRVAVQNPEDFGVLSLDGTWSPGTTGWNGRDEDPDTGEAYLVRGGRHAAGRLLDGVLHDAIPEVPGAR